MRPSEEKGDVYVLEKFEAKCSGALRSEVTCSTRFWLQLLLAQFQLGKQIHGCIWCTFTLIYH